MKEDIKILKFNESESVQKSEITHIKGKLFSKHSVPITNNPKILDWLCKLSTSSYEKGEKNLFKNLIEELTSLFGPHNLLLRLEFNSKIWILKYKDLTFNIFTAKGKGTSIEICDSSYKSINRGDHEKEIIEFLTELHSLINNI